jgi:hypothetical protein
VQDGMSARRALARRASRSHLIYAGQYEIPWLVNVLNSALIPNEPRFSRAKGSDRSASLLGRSAINYDLIE